VTREATPLLLALPQPRRRTRSTVVGRTRSTVVGRCNNSENCNPLPIN
jgi:hypothetical protein